jgi:leucyl-tRNA synthetase
VDFYVGGAEHAARHLIYARFWHKFLFDIGVVKYQEPFKKLQNVGLILAEDGKKMSKRYGNVVNPDAIVETYGADSLRLYEMFMGPFDQEISWKTDNIIGVRRFLEKVWRLQEKVVVDTKKKTEALDNTTEILFNQTIKKVTDDINALGFNTAISQMMILVNQFEKVTSIPQSVFLTLIKLLAPFAPHVSEELWLAFNQKGSVHLASWPEYDSNKLVLSTVTVMVQVNGKVRDQFEAENGVSKEMMEKMALASKYIQENFKDKTPSRIIVVPNKIVNLVY